MRLALSIAVSLAAATAAAGTKLHLRVGAVDPSLLAAPNQGRLAQNVPETRLWVLQFRGTIQPENRAAIEARGWTVVSYLPDDAYLIRLPSAVSQLPSLPAGVRAAVAYRADWKADPGLQPLSVFNAQLPQPVLVLTTDERAAEAVAQSLSNFPVELLDDKTLQVTLPRAQVNDLLVSDDVLWVEPALDYRLLIYGWTDNDMQPLAEEQPGQISDLTGYESGVRVLNAPAAWAKGYQGVGQVVAAADSGLDRGDKDLLSKDFSRFVAGQAFGRLTWSWADSIGHGTHVLGSVGGTGEASGGAITGAAKGAGLIMQSMYTWIGGGLSVPSNLNKMMMRTHRLGARVHTNSWGAAMGEGVYNGMARSVDEIMWNQPDLLVLFAAGNSGVDRNRDGRVDPGSVSPPATAKNILSVGASENLVSNGGIQKKMSELRRGKDMFPVEPLASDTFSNNPQGVALFSSRGPTLDGRIKPDIVAPGTNILSNCSQKKDAGKLWGAFNEEYCFSGGTSMATPLAAGAAAITREYLTKHHKLENPSAAVVKAVMMHTATDLFPGQFGEVGEKAGQELLKTRPDINQGFGRVDLEAITSQEHARIYDETEGVGAGQAKRYSVTGGPIMVTLVYTDAPGSLSAQRALVNDLDLEIVGKGPDGADISVVSASRVDNFEYLQATLPEGAVYTVRVVGRNVPQGKSGKQPFGLILSRPPGASGLGTP